MIATGSLHIYRWMNGCSQQNTHSVTVPTLPKCGPKHLFWHIPELLMAPSEWGAGGPLICVGVAAALSS